MDFGSSERLGSWREDEARPGAGVCVGTAVGQGMDGIFWGMVTIGLGPTGPSRRTD